MSDSLMKIHKSQIKKTKNASSAVA